MQCGRAGMSVFITEETGAREIAIRDGQPAVLCCAWSVRACLLACLTGCFACFLFGARAALCLPAKGSLIRLGRAGVLPPPSYKVP